MEADWVELREYRARDLDQMFCLDEECFEERFRFDRATLEELSEAPGAVVVVAYARGAGGVVGFVIVNTAAGMGYIATLDVALNCRRRGLAARMLEAAEQRCLQAGVQRMGLHVHVGNAGAIHFYQRLGYVRYRLERGFYGRGVDGWSYRKLLSAG